jgi:hypothetical protein
MPENTRAAATRQAFLHSDVITQRSSVWAGSKGLLHRRKPQKVLKNGSNWPENGQLQMEDKTAIELRRTN